MSLLKQCLKKTGYLDEIYGRGYGEETDYQFKAMKEGFSAKVAIDTYVYQAMRTLGFSYSTAVGLMQSVMGLILITIANKYAKKINEGEGLF